MSGSKNLRSRLPAAMLLLLVAVAFVVFAPTRIGGTTDYVTTSGDSMAPRFHTGDLALIRPARQYRVGDVVAYHSTVLHTVVMHRIVARRHGRYVLKGDNNNFTDPSPAGRSQLIGKLWLRVPHAGRALDWLHTPAITAMLLAAGLLLLMSTSRRRRRPDRRRGTPTRPPQGARNVARPRPHINAQQILAASGAVAVAAIALTAFAFTRPAATTVTAKTPYNQQVSFAYHAQAPRGPVYRGGVVKTGAPLFLRLVHRVRVTVGYHVTASAPHQLTGTMKIIARLTSPSGWTHNVGLSSPTRFTGDRARNAVTLDLRRLRSLVDRAQTLTGAPAGGAYTLAIVPRVKLTGTLAGTPLASTFTPALSFTVDALAMKPGSTATRAGAKAGGFHPSQKATVARPARAPNTLTIRGQRLAITTVRWIALAGLLLAAAGALLSRLPRLRRPSDPAAYARARYEHLIVAISAIAPHAARSTVDVNSIDALAQLADRSQRLILHHHHPDADTYLVDDEGTLYRYQTRPAAHHPPTPSVLHAANRNDARGNDIPPAHASNAHRA